MQAHKYISTKYEMVNGIAIVDAKTRPKGSRIGQRGDSLTDMVPRGFMFYAQFLKELYFMRKIKNTHAILDLGCGTAALLEKLYRNGSKCTYIGLDISISSLTKRASIATKETVNAILAQVDFTDRIPIIDNSIDTIICSEVIEHFTKQGGELLLAEMKRVLKPNGLLLLTTTHGLGIKAGHLQEYEFDEMVKVITQQGFTYIDGAGLYIADIRKLDKVTLEVLTTLKKFYPTPFLKSILAYKHAKDSRTYLIEARNDECK